MSHCAISILLVHEKDNTWCMCVDCRAIKNITVKYKHHIPKLDDILCCNPILAHWLLI